MLVLVLETSTSSAKALLYDSAAGIVASKSIPYDNHVSDVATQDCDAVYRLALEAGRQVARGKGVDAIAICGTWHSILACDRDMKPATRTFSWAYAESRAETAGIRADITLARDLYSRTGCMIHGTYGFYTLLHLANGGMKLDDKLFASQGGYIFHEMTGRRLESASTMSGAGFVNIHTQQYDPLVLSMLGADAGQFGQLATYRDTFPLKPEAASLLGLSPGIPVVPAYPDGAMNQVGAGALEKGIMTLSVGTSAAMRLSVDSPLIPAQPSTWCYIGADTRIAGAAIAGACSCVDWFRQKIAGTDIPFAKLDKAAQEKDDSPVFLPFIFGERCPGWRDDRLGGFLGLAPDHSSGAMYRAVLEGVCFNLLQCYRILTEVAGEPSEIRLSGGILNSPFWTQMLADVFGKKMRAAAFSQASSMGAAALALAACGEIPDLSAFRPGGYADIEPDEAAKDHYAPKYERYLRWYATAR